MYLWCLMRLLVPNVRIHYSCEETGSVSVSH